MNEHLNLLLVASVAAMIITYIIGLIGEYYKDNSTVIKVLCGLLILLTLGYGILLVYTISILI